MPTFIEYDPATHDAGTVLGAVLGLPAGMSVVPGSTQIRSGLASAMTYGGIGGNGDGYPDIPGFPDFPGLPGLSMVRSISFYDGSLPSLGIGAGLLLSTGGAVPPSINAEEGYSGVFENTTPPQVDPELQAVARAAFDGAGDLFDTTSLSFTLNVTDPTIRGLRFDLVFASDEYPEFANSAYVDIAAVIVNGANYALFNQQATQPLSVVERNIASGNFRDNRNTTIPLEYDGISRTLSVVAPLNPGLNTIKIGVADTGDEIYDSALFVARIQAVDFSGFGLAPIIQVAPPVQGPAPKTQDQIGNQIYTFLSGFEGVLSFGSSSGNPGSTTPGGNDVVDGSEAFVTVKFDSPLAALQGLELLPDGFKLTLPDGIKVLNDVERIAFDDLMVALDTEVGAPAWNALALLKAVLGTAPAPATLSPWVLAADNAANPVALAGQILDSFLPGVTPENLIAHLCQTLLGFTPPPDMLASLAALIGPNAAFPTDDAFFHAVATTEGLNSMVAFTGLPLLLDPAAFIDTW
jgi:hypothetical protein